MLNHPLVLAILPAIIGGIFTLLGVWLGERIARQQARAASGRRYEIALPTSVQRAEVQVDRARGKPSRILRDAGLILLTQNVAILFSASVLGWSSLRAGDLLTLTLMIGAPVLLVGFAVIGVQAGNQRWEQLRGVAWLYWLVNAVVLFFIGTIDLPLALLSAFPVLLIMGLGGLISGLLAQGKIEEKD